MSHSLPYISASFYLQKAVAIAPAVIRIRFTYVPKAANVGAENDATNPANYRVTGAGLVEVTSVSKVDDDPQSLDIYLNVPLAPGLWNILASNTIQAFDDNANLTTPNSITFAAARIKAAGPINGGALSDSAVDIIRKHLPPSFAGPAWDSLIEGLALGDAVNWRNAQAAFDQLFVSTASGNYLDRRASDGGITRPSAVGVADEAFRQFAIRTSAEKLTSHSILQILETFYGSDAVRARMETKNPEPYRLEDEDTLRIGVDNIAPVEFVFRKRDFARIGLATAVEVAAALNRQFRELRFPAFAATKQDLVTLKNKVVVYSASLGLGSSVCAFGGFADNSLQFPDLINLGLSVASESDPVGSSFDISNPAPSIARIYLVEHPEPAFADVQVGDCVNVWGDRFHEGNRGTFTVIDVGVEYNNSWTQYIDVVNENVVPQSDVALDDIDDFVMFRPVRQSPSSQSGVIVSQTSDGIDVVLPATTTVVQRDELSGAHINGVRPLNIEDIQVNADGMAVVTTSANHFLSVGDLVQIADLRPSTALPEKTSGSATKTSYAPIPATDTFALPAGATFSSGAAIAAIDDSTLLVCGGDSKSAVVINLPEGVGGSAGHYNVLPEAVADMDVELSGHTATALSGVYAGKVLVIGGKTGAVASSYVYLYDIADDEWAIVPSSMTARFGHTTTALTDSLGEEVLLVHGGKVDGTSLASKTFKFAGNSFSEVAALSSDGGRFGHAAVATAPNTMLVAGGESLSGPLSTTFTYNVDTDTVQNCGKLSTARASFALVALPSGSAIAIGGLGRNLSNETTNRAVSECEMWDSDARSWRPAGRLAYARISPMAALIGNHIYVMGGASASGAPVTATERYDIKTGEWTVLSALASTSTNTLVASVKIGPMLVGVSSADISVLTARTPRPATPAMHETFRVSTVITPTQFAFAVSPDRHLASDSGTVIPLTAPVATNPGPYLFNPYGGLGVTGTDATLLSSVFADQQYSKLLLGNEQALAFPDEPGWICLNYGTDQVVGPIPYLGRVSDSELMLDYSFKFPKSASANSTVTLLNGKGAYVPPRPEQLGSFYVTASSSGRVVAQAAIESVLAAGLDDKLRVTVVYPGDKGLGNAGYGVTGPKLSDKVAVWGGSDLDSELAEAREEE